MNEDIRGSRTSAPSAESPIQETYRRLAQLHYALSVADTVSEKLHHRAIDELMDVLEILEPLMPARQAAHAERSTDRQPDHGRVTGEPERDVVGVELAFRQATDGDFEYLYRLNEATIRPYAEQTYGPWDETLARRLFAEQFDPTTTRILLVDGQDAGMLQVEPREGYVHLTNIRIAPVYQRRGIGTRLIPEVLDGAHRRGLPVTLRVLKVNPARRLYERLGFVAIEEDERHFVMEARPPM